MRTRWGVAVRIKSARLMWLTETVVMHYNNKDGRKDILIVQGEGEMVILND
jgi:hypothetical protein